MLAAGRGRYVAFSAHRVPRDVARARARARGVSRDVCLAFGQCVCSSVHSTTRSDHGRERRERTRFRSNAP